MRILLTVDVNNWAFAHKARAIKKYLPQHDITIKRYATFKHDDLRKYDHIHFFSTVKAAIAPFTTASVTSHNYRLKTWEFSRDYFPGFTALSCVSRKIYEDLRDNNLNDTLYLCMNGVDHEKFYVQKDKQPDDIFRVLWVGVKKKQPLPDRNVDVKGFCLTEELKRKLAPYKDIEFTIHDNTHKNALPHEKMVQLYHNHDVLLCLSCYEGTPNPVFEAAASGLPIISTPVGCTTEFLVDGINGLSIPNYYDYKEGLRMLDECVERILYLKKNRQIGIDMGLTGRRIIEESWTWKDRAQQWLPVFENHTRRK